MALSDVNNVLVERYAYDVFGRPTIRDANGAEIGETAVGNPYLFTGRRYDAETALYYYRARYYDYYAGRFLQPDPTGYTDGLNLYAYVGNNPGGFVDPFGLYEVPRHREFGDYGNMNPFDYGACDSVYPPTDPRYTRMHFRDVADVCVDLEKACKAGDPVAFSLLMHQLQDPGVHGTGTAAIARHIWYREAIDNPDRNDATKAATALTEWWTKYWEAQWRAYNPGFIETYEALESLNQSLVDLPEQLDQFLESLTPQRELGVGEPMTRDSGPRTQVSTANRAISRCGVSQHQYNKKK